MPLGVFLIALLNSNYYHSYYLLSLPRQGGGSFGAIFRIFQSSEGGSFAALGSVSSADILPFNLCSNPAIL